MYKTKGFCTKPRDSVQNPGLMYKTQRLCTLYKPNDYVQNPEILYKAQGFCIKPRYSVQNQEILYKTQRFCTKHRVSVKNSDILYKTQRLKKLKVSSKLHKWRHRNLFILATLFHVPLPLSGRIKKIFLRRRNKKLK